MARTTFGPVTGHIWVDTIFQTIPFFTVLNVECTAVTRITVETKASAIVAHAVVGTSLRRGQSFTGAILCRRTIGTFESWITDTSTTMAHSMPRTITGQFGATIFTGIPGFTNTLAHETFTFVGTLFVSHPFGSITTTSWALFHQLAIFSFVTGVANTLAIETKAMATASIFGIFCLVTAGFSGFERRTGFTGPPFKTLTFPTYTKTIFGTILRARCFFRTIDPFVTNFASAFTVITQTTRITTTFKPTGSFGARNTSTAIGTFVSGITQTFSVGALAVF
jgi:hypothetical protein